eukprot:scaffold231072_cov33-Cyclotella_meneghiniana.AAC.1
MKTRMTTRTSSLMKSSWDITMLISVTAWNVTSICPKWSNPKTILSATLTFVSSSKLTTNYYS